MSRVSQNLMPFRSPMKKGTKTLESDESPNAGLDIMRRPPKRKPDPYDIGDDPEATGNDGVEDEAHIEQVDENKAHTGTRAPIAEMGGTSMHLHAFSASHVEPARDSFVEQDAEEQLARQTEEEDVHEIEKLLEHKVADNEAGRIVLLVKWVSDPEPTWEPEEEIQDGASELLFAYWKEAGGRDAVLFQGTRPLLKEKFWVYRILQHRRTSGFQFQIQWVGYPADDANTTWEPEAKVKKIANTLLDDYWSTKGGRNQFLGKRGRNKKT